MRNALRCKALRMEQERGLEPLTLCLGSSGSNGVCCGANSFAGIPQSQFNNTKRALVENPARRYLPRRKGCSTRGLSLYLRAINSSICERNCSALSKASRIWLGETVPGAS